MEIATGIAPRPHDSAMDIATGIAARPHESSLVVPGSGYHMEFSNGSTYKVTQLFFSIYFFLPVCPVETTLQKTSNPGAGKMLKYPASAPSVGCQLWLLALARTATILMVLACCAIAMCTQVRVRHVALASHVARALSVPIPPVAARIPP